MDFLPVGYTIVTRATWTRAEDHPPLVRQGLTSHLIQISRHPQGVHFSKLFCTGRLVILPHPRPWLAADGAGSIIA